MTSMHLIHIEDEGPLRDILKIALMSAEPGLDLVQFASGDEAADYIRQRGQLADLFVIDLRLPGTLNGMNVAQLIRELKCPGFIVLTSAYGSPERSVLTTLDCDYLPKPWHIPDLVESLSRYKLSNRPAKLESNTGFVDSSGVRQSSVGSSELVLSPTKVGNSTDKMLVCPTCGHVYVRTDPLCANCGMMLSESETRRLSDTDKQEDKRATQPSPSVGTAFSQGPETIVFQIEGQRLTMPTRDTIVVGRRTGSGNVSTQLDVDLSFFQAVTKGVSRRHIQISRKGVLLYVTDLDTLNGTWLNGRRVSGYNERLLRDGDELKLGQLKMRIWFKQ